jgi:hypothetical protein
MPSKPMHIEYAGGSNGPLPDEVLRTKLRNAPGWVLDEVEAYRETRNLPPLFARRTAAITTKAPARQAIPTKPPARSKPTAPAITGTLVAAIAPGMSEPVSITKRGTEMPETISHAAWRKLAASLRKGLSVPVTHGHGGRLITSTSSTRFRFDHHPVAGLICEVDLVKGDPMIVHWQGVSIGFRNARHHEAFIDGRRCRVVDELELQHVAILDRDEVPAYSLARVRRCLPGLARESVIDVVIDCGKRIKREWPTLLAKPV